MYYMTSLRLALLPLLAAFVVTGANAELQSRDSEYGPATITRDTSSGLDWLDLTVTTNRSFNDISAQLGVGGQFEGFRYATTAEISAMWTSAGIVDITTQGPLHGSNWTAANYDAAQTLAGLFGVTVTLPGGVASEGFTADEVPGNPSLHIVGEINICTLANGCPLTGAQTHTALASLGPNQKDLVTPFTFAGHFLVRVPADTDADGIPDDSDNCTQIANEDQRDTNADGIGNVCDPDLDGDCVVNFNDLGLLKSVFFTPDPDADFDGSGSVNFGDLGVVKAFFFLPPGPSGVPNDCAARPRRK
jgi:hypothetical protein